MRKSVVVLFLILVISLITLQAASKRSRTADPSIQIPGVAINAMQKIDPERIRAHVRFLSHDLLEGRGTGQRGGDIAAEYIATQFALDGLQPAGDNGTFLQKVPMVGVTPDPATTFSLVGSILIHQTEMASYPWEVVRNSNSGEKSYLKLEGTPKLKVASWIHLEAARALANMAGMDVDKIIADAQSRSFHPAPLDVRLKA